LEAAATAALELPFLIADGKIVLRYYSSHYECVREDILALSIANTYCQSLLYCHDMLSHRSSVLMVQVGRSYDMQPRY
jgi:hypothetical protein